MNPFGKQPSDRKGLSGEEPASAGMAGVTPFAIGNGAVRDTLAL